MGKQRKGLVKSRGGNTAMMFGLVALPLATAIGVGLDVSYASSERVNLQAAQDGATLAAGLQYLSISGVTKAQREAAATEHGRRQLFRVGAVESRRRSAR